MEYLDTLSVYDCLAKAGLPDAASRVLSEVFKDHTQQQLELLATKKDMMISLWQARRRWCGFELPEDSLWFRNDAPDTKNIPKKGCAVI
ncbi:MAG: hypothetical protein HQK58_09130 [Deltaproteobacteria bacterium]|nr:hypothetical protein [Deltaproteobacteria bacterium]